MADKAKGDTAPKHDKKAESGKETDKKNAEEQKDIELVIIILLVFLPISIFVIIMSIAHVVKTALSLN